MIERLANSFLLHHANVRRHNDEKNGTNSHVIMTPEDDFDIRESFHVMDEERTGEIDSERFHTLCLGLGYELEREDLETLLVRRQQRLDGGITVDTVLEILSNVRVLCA